MHIKIYFSDKPVYLCDEIDAGLNEILHHPETVFVDEISGPAMKSMLHEIQKPAFHAGVLWHSDLKLLKKAFFKNFTLIEAAGGIVQNSDKEILFILRLGKWDLPKGKMEKGEDEASCATREVMEETGVKNLTVKKKLGETYHTYEQFGKHFLQISHWFFMNCPANQETIPQTEEDITEAKWVKTKNIKDPLKNTYPSIKDILDRFFDAP